MRSVRCGFVCVKRPAGVFLLAFLCWCGVLVGLVRFGGCGVVFPAVECFLADYLVDVFESVEVFSGG